MDKYAMFTYEIIAPAQKDLPFEEGVPVEEDSTEEHKRQRLDMLFGGNNVSIR